jgi:uncharacterized PurR-regulated membrane protein YhhQ (DUF165 family)
MWLWIFLYVGSVTAINVAFAYAPQYEWAWAMAVGFIFVARDYCQRQMGHWVVLPMLVGIALSYLLATPFVAFASAAAFAISESTDWLVFTFTKRPLRDRVLWSCAASSPVDSAVFLHIIGILSLKLFLISVTSKMLAGLVVWVTLTSNDLLKRPRIT